MALDVKKEIELASVDVISDMCAGFADSLSIWVDEYGTAPPHVEGGDY